MDTDTIFRVILAVCFLLVAGARRWFERQSAQTTAEGLAQDRDSKRLVALQSLLLWCHQALGLNFFGGLKMHAGHRLVTSGPYRWVRHPMYAAFLALGAAWFGLSESWFIAGFWLSGSILAVATRLEKEEAMLLAQFGDEYRSYRRRTGRLLPRFGPVDHPGGGA